MNLTRRTFLNATAAAPLIATANSSAQRPNVVMFMTDDHGAWATGAYGCPEIHTPNIDSLAPRGSAVCPSLCVYSRLFSQPHDLHDRHAAIGPRCAGLARARRL